VIARWTSNSNVTHMPDISAIQKALNEQKLDGWLFYDILHRDAIAYRVLGLEHAMAKRRWFYMIPAKGAPRKLVHRIEAAALDSLPGEKMVYAAAEELEKNLKKLVGARRKWRCNIRRRIRSRTFRWWMLGPSS